MDAQAHQAVDESRKRVKIACEGCRKNKRKCNGQLPACALCEKSGKQCIYPPETSVKKRKYWDEEYVHSLEDQIATLKTLLAESSRKEAYEAISSHEENRLRDVYSTSMSTSDMAASNDSGHGKQILLDEAEDPSTPPIIVHRSQTAMDELGSLMLSMGIEDRGEPSFIIPMGRSILSENSEAVIAGVKNPVNFPEVKDPLRKYLNDANLRQHLLECFMKYYNPYHQYLDTKKSEDIVLGDQVTQSIELCFRNCALFAVACHFSPLPDSLRIASEFASYAEQLSLHCLRYVPCEAVVQGLSLLAWRELVLGNDSMGYNLNSMATGLALQLGLHITARDNPAQQLAGPRSGVLSRRIRTFWAYFSVERFANHTLGMNCTMPFGRVKLPGFIAIVDGQETIDELSFYRQGQLWHLWDSLMDQIYAFGWDELSDAEKNKVLLRSHEGLTSFRNKFEDCLQIRKDHMPDSVVYLHLAYHTALLLVHRPFLYSPPNSTILRFALRSVTSAAASISRILRAFKRSRIQGFKTVLPHIISYISSAAVIHLLNATSGQTVLGRQATSGLRICLDALVDMRSSWQVRVDKVIQVLQELAHKWKVAWALPLPLSSPLPFYKSVVRSDGVVGTTQLPGTTIAVDDMSGNEAQMDSTLDAIYEVGADVEWDPLYMQNAMDQIIMLESFPDIRGLDWLFGHE